MLIKVIRSVDEGEGSIQSLVGQEFTTSEEHDPLEDGTVYVETENGLYPIKPEEYERIDALRNVELKVTYGAPVNEGFKDSDAWTCTIKYKRKQMTIPFYKGYGHEGKEPQIEEVLSALFLDATADDYSSFESWCNEFGYDEDSRKDEKIYKECIKIAKNLQRVFGQEYEEIADAVRDY